MADSMGIKIEGFDDAVKMLQSTAPDEAKKQVRASMRFATNRVKARLKATAPRGKTGSVRHGQYFAPGYLARKGIITRSSTNKKTGTFTSRVTTSDDGWYGWVLNVGRYLTGGTRIPSEKMASGSYFVRNLSGFHKGWIDRSINPRKVADEAIREFIKRFGTHG